jgi:sugar lactone lactonase YvrE
MSKTAKLVLDSRAKLGEGPIWDDQQQLLYWVDILGNSLQVFDPSSGENQSYEIGQPVGTVVPTHHPAQVMLALQHGFAAYDLDKQKLALWHDPEAHLPENRFNDGKCDPAGRFWAGTMGRSGQEKSGSLYCLHANGTVKKRLDNIGISNGLAWSLDGSTMYIIDSNTAAVQAFDFEIESGTISNGRIIIRVPPAMGTPDGMTMDAEGMLWIALWDGGRVGRWNPATGQLLESVTCPVTRTTACAFGGPALDTLYITSASVGLSAAQLEREPLAGGLFAIKPGCQGLPAYRFGG